MANQQHKPNRKRSQQKSRERSAAHEQEQALRHTKKMKVFEMGREEDGGRSKFGNAGTPIGSDPRE